MIPTQHSSKNDPYTIYENILDQSLCGNIITFFNICKKTNRESTWYTTSRLIHHLALLVSDKNSINKEEKTATVK